MSTPGALIVLIGAPAFWQHLRHRSVFQPRGRAAATATLLTAAARLAPRLAPPAPPQSARRGSKDGWTGSARCCAGRRRLYAARCCEQTHGHMLRELVSNAISLTVSEMEPHLSMKRASGLSPTKNAGHVLFCFCAVARFAACEMRCICPQISVQRGCRGCRWGPQEPRRSRRLLWPALSPNIASVGLPT